MLIRGMPIAIIIANEIVANTNSTLEIVTRVGEEAHGISKNTKNTKFAKSVSAKNIPISRYTFLSTLCRLFSIPFCMLLPTVYTISVSMII